jgi:hypothetical protein
MVVSRKVTRPFYRPGIRLSTPAGQAAAPAKRRESLCVLCPALCDLQARGWRDQRKSTDLSFKTARALCLFGMLWWTIR